MADQPEHNAAADPNWVGVNDGAPDDESYDPSTVSATRGREQGLGVGARDLDRQRDPSRPATGDGDGEDADEAAAPETGSRDADLAG